MEFEAVIENMKANTPNANPTRPVDKGLFVITNEINGKQYVGKSNYLGSVTLFHPSNLLLKDIQTLGKANFTLILMRPPDLIPNWIRYPELELEDLGLSALKKAKILELGSMKPNGYNQQLPQIPDDTDVLELFGSRVCKFCGYNDVPLYFDFEYCDGWYFCKNNDCYWQWQSMRYL